VYTAVYIADVIHHGTIYKMIVYDDALAIPET
jgi:hypothetical protein